MLNRRECLAAVQAAIATPADHWRKAWEAEKKKRADADLRPDLGLTPIQAEVREALRSRILETIQDLTSEPGHGALADMWLLSESLVEYSSGSHNGEFAGLFNAINETLGRNCRFVAVPEDLHADVQAFIETRKAEPHRGSEVGSDPDATPQAVQPENVITFPDGAVRLDEGLDEAERLEAIETLQSAIDRLTARDGAS